MAYNKYDSQHGATNGVPNIVNYYNIKEVPLNEDDGDWFSHLKFDTSWDWLMPVVEKITPLAEKMGQQGWFDVKYLLVFTNREATHKAVVEFIRWYKTQGGKGSGNLSVVP